MITTFPLSISFTLFIIFFLEFTNYKVAKWQKFVRLNPNPAHKQKVGHLQYFPNTPKPNHKHITQTLKIQHFPKNFYISTTTKKYWMLNIFDGYFGYKIRLYKKHKNS